MDTIMNMTLGQVFGRISGVIVVLSVFIEITPIRINPVSALLKWVGERTNKELSDKVADIDTQLKVFEERITDIKAEVEENNAVSCRIRILRFGDEVRRGMRHSKENFDQVLSDIDNYDLYCVEHPEFKNNKTAITTKAIREAYTICMRDNDFL